MPRPDPVKALQATARQTLSALADPVKAPAMQAYMKSEMPYYGVSAAPLQKACKELFAAHPLPDKATWQRAILTLWREAERREERYVAVGLSGARAYQGHRSMDLLPMYEELITSGAWWDYVDSLAVHRLGPLLLDEPAAMKQAMLAWSRDADLWKRRSAILCQVAAKQQIDLDLLYRTIEPNLADKQFFIRKAIGWALRSHAWIDAPEVSRYVAENEERLSGLSRREALKNIKA